MAVRFREKLQENNPAKIAEREPKKKGNCSLSKGLLGASTALAIFLAARLGVQPSQPQSELNHHRQIYRPSAPYEVPRSAIIPSSSCDISFFPGSSLSQMKKDQPELRPQYKTGMVRPQIVTLGNTGIGYRVTPDKANFRLRHPLHNAMTIEAVKATIGNPEVQNWIQNPVGKGYLIVIQDPKTGLQTDSLVGVDTVSREDYSKAEKYTQK